MASTQQQQSSHRAAAVRAAEASLNKHTTMRGKDALRVAQHVVDRAAGHLEAEAAERLAHISRTEVTVAAVTAVVALALDTFITADVIRRGGRTARVCAAAGFAVNVALAVYGQHRKHRVRQAARALYAESSSA